jgi:hypothetical protein
VKILQKFESKNPRLDPESFRRIVGWFDLNCQFFGDYGPVRAERKLPSCDGEKNLREHVAATCGSCHANLAAQPLAALVNISQPEESRVLKAPLETKSGGWSQCKGVAWPDTNSGGCKTMLQKILATLPPPGETNTVDLTASSGAHCN